MKHFLVCDPSGNILRKGVCQDGDFALQAKLGELVFEGFGNDARDKVDVLTGKVLKDVVPLPIPPAFVPQPPTVYEKIDAVIDFLATLPAAKAHPKLKALLDKLGK